MRYFLIFIIVIIAVVAAVNKAKAADCVKEAELVEFGCKPFVNCMPCHGGWCKIRGKKF